MYVADTKCVQKNSGNMKGRHHLGDRSVVKRIILKCFLNKYCTDYMWFRIDPVARSCKHENESLYYIKYELFYVLIERLLTS